MPATKRKVLPLLVPYTPKLWSHLSPNGDKYQLDYILIRKKWRDSVKDAQAHFNFASIGSDHRIVSAKVRLSLRSNHKGTMRKIRYDWKMLKEDDELQERYTLTVKNRFHALTIENESATEEYERFIRANEEAAKEVLPQIKGTRRQQRSDDIRLSKDREVVEEAFEKYQQNPDEASRELLRKARTNLYEKYDELEEENISMKINQIENAQHDNQYKLSWKLINEISGRKASRKGQIEGDTKEERTANWFKHFQGLLGNPPDIGGQDEEIDQILEELKINDGPFTKEEYNKAKRSITEGKACGEDNIPPEVLKRCNLDEEILGFCNRALLEGRKPEQWSIMNIIPIPKTGDLSKGNNYRGISLSSLVAKTYNRMILNRIRPAIEPHLRINQNGFRPGRTTTSQILALRRLIEGIKDKNLPAIIIFIDFKKAFDTIHRGKLIKILRAYGIPEKLVRAIEVMYTDTKAKVLSPDGKTELFNILAGVLQGDTLAQYLFIIALDYALGKAINGREEELGFQIQRRQSRRIRPVCISDLDFADDIALISEQVKQAQTLLDRVETAAAAIGLMANPKKTKMMTFNCPSKIDIKTSDGSILEEVDDFTYLGSLVSSSRADIAKRIGLAWAAHNKMSRIWRSTLSRKTKTRLFRSTVESVFLYGSAAWTLTETLAKKIDGCFTRLLRSALGFTWKDHVSNKELYAEVPKATDTVKQKRLKLAGHCYRHPEEAASNLVLWTPNHGKRGRGRPARTFVQQLRDDTGLKEREMASLMMMRDQWRILTGRCLQHRPR